MSGGSIYKDYRFWLAIPDRGAESCNWVKMKEDVYDYKDYPRCECGRRYVPTRQSQDKCLNCLYNYER